ncbi:MAG TPA: sugar ABC transporter ATP-binding protein [Tepidisphaeraceae bacterium]|nr:sugar ABC transporter ATP-binding protein [Tepidisphaeraceae bacterium]
MTDATPLLRIVHIAKRFGTTAALSDVSFDVYAGQVHALVGENGAGKSTLMKILAGAEQADSGQIALRGEPFSPREPLDSLRAGIAMIYQELNLAPHLSVEANLILGRERTLGGFLSDETLRGQAHQHCRATLDRLGVRAPLHEKVGKLGVADQQMIEIARALLRGAKLLIMDEPTSALAAHEVGRLLELVRKLRSEGNGIIYISHFLEEVEEIADRLTVLRDGRSVGGGAIGDWPRQRIIEAMVGRHVEEMYPKVEHAIGPPLLVVRDLKGETLPRRAELVLHRGEILGIAGLVGAGRTETLRTLFGLDPRTGGEASMNGVNVRHFSPDDWARRGVGMLSEDRKTEGLAQNLSCVANMTLPAMDRAARYGWIRRGGERRAARQLARTLNIRWADPEQNVSSLSGGNQQKVALARLLYAQADVLLLDEPTRGIDVGAKVDIYRAMGELAARGKAVIMVSSYLPELFGVCDRIAVMSRGVLSAAHDVCNLTPEMVMRLAVGDA